MAAIISLMAYCHYIVIVELKPKNKKNVFHYEQRPEFLILKQKFGSGITLPELKSIALVLQQTLHLKKIPRDYKRSFEKLVYWFTLNWSSISSVLNYIHLFDEKLVEITFSNEQTFHK